MRKLFAKAQDRVSCETHAFGAAAALCGALVYVLRGMWTDAAVPAVAAAMCFCLSMAALYAASAVYHYYPGTAASGGVKRMLRKMDHSMIYVLIARATPQRIRQNRVPLGWGSSTTQKGV